MHHSFLDKYSDLDSLIHRRHPLVKELGYIVLLLVILSASISRPAEFLLIALLLLGLTLLSKVPISFFLRKTLLLIPIGIFLLALLPFLKGAEIIWQGRFILPLTLTIEGINFSLSLAMKSILVLWTTVLLLSTTRFNELLYAQQALGVPRLMITIFAFIYRYVFLLIEESERVERARRARLFARQRVPIFFNSLSFLLRAIFIRTFERSGRIYQAMCARGFSGEVFLLRKLKLSIRDIMIGFFFFVIIGVIKFATFLVSA